MLHDAGDATNSGPFHRGLARARLDRLFTSSGAAGAFSELMTGMDFGEDAGPQGR